MLSKEFDVLKSEALLDGFHIAKVIDNQDPLALERVRVRVLGIHDWDNEEKENSIWAIHLCTSKSNSGEIPDVDDFLWVVFYDKENPSSCMWIGWARTIT